MNEYYGGSAFEGLALSEVGQQSLDHVSVTPGGDNMSHLMSVLAGF